MFCHSETITNHSAFELMFYSTTAFIIIYRRLERLSAHDRTVHLLFRQPAQYIGDILISYVSSFFDFFFWCCGKII